MPGGIYRSTKSTASRRRRTRTSTIAQNNSNIVSQCHTHSLEVYCLGFESLIETMEKRIDAQWKAFEIEFICMRKRVRELEKEVLYLREILLDVQKPSLEGTKLVSDTDFVCTNVLKQTTNK